MVTPDPREVLQARFERLIDLPAFLGQRGYEATGPTTPAGLTMTNPATGDHLILKKDLVRGSWSYTNPRDPSDHGTIAAYLGRRGRVSSDACLDRPSPAWTLGGPTMSRPSGVTGAVLCEASDDAPDFFDLVRRARRIA